MIPLRVFMGITVLLAESYVQASKLFARDCSFKWPAYEDDTCETIANSWDISEADFLSYNPGAICSALEAGKEYCVEWTGTLPNTPPTTPAAIPSPLPTRTTLFTSTIRSTASIASSPSPTPTSGTCESTPSGVITPSPIQTGITCGCTKFYHVASGDGCWAIANANEIELDDFYAWNPAVGNECKSLQPDTYVCIRKATTPQTTSIGSYVPVYCSWDTKLGQYICPKSTAIQQSSTTTSTKRPSPSSSSKPTPPPTSTGPYVPVYCSWDTKLGQYVCPGTATQQPTTTTNTRPPSPGPTQSGVSTSCIEWVMQKDGVYCYDMAAAAGITLDRLYALNPSLNGDCSGLWAGYAYCIGTS